MPNESKRAELMQAIARFVAQRSQRGPADFWGRHEAQDDEFQALALELLRFQASANAVYQRYCLRLGVDAQQALEAFDFPPLPTEAFKRQTVVSFEPTKAQACFVSSGSTASQRGRHYIRELELMEAGYEAPFRHALLPTLGEGHASARQSEGFGAGASSVAERERKRTESIRMLILAPRAEDAPQSSLYHMFSCLHARFGSKNSAHLADASGRLDVPRALQLLREAANGEEPVLLMGAAFSYVHLLDALEGEVTLPPLSRALQTGGYKGKSRELEKTEFEDSLVQRLGLAREAVIGEYGMSELSSQLYQRRWELGGIGQASSGQEVDTLDAYSWPPWCVPRVLEPQSLAPMAAGELGQIALLDLLNLDSVAYVLTGDLGRLDADGLHLQGRSPTATPKGCSLAFDQAQDEG